MKRDALEKTARLLEIALLLLGVLNELIELVQHFL